MSLRLSQVDLFFVAVAPAPIASQDLLSRLRAGDEESFRTLTEQYHGALLRFARSLGASEASAEEVVQDTWLAVIEGLASFGERSTLKTWIFSILANIARRRAARDARMAPLSDLFCDHTVQRLLDSQDAACPTGAPTRTFSWSINPSDRIEQEALLRVIQQALEALPANQRSVLLLRDFEGVSSTEVCSILSVSEANHRVLLHRARNTVRKAVTEYYQLTEEEALP